MPHLDEGAERPDATTGAPLTASAVPDLVGGAPQPHRTAQPLDATVPDRRLRARDFAIVLFVAFGGATGAALWVLWAGYPKVGADMAALGLFHNALIEVAALALLVHLLARQGRTLRDLGLTFSWKDLPLALLLVVVGFLLEAECWRAISILVPRITGRPLAVQDSWRRIYMEIRRSSVWVWMFVLVNPWYEELIVRAFTITEVEALTGSAVGAVLVSFGVQTLYHLYYGVPTALAMGATFLLYSLVYQRWRRITPIVLAHLAMDVLPFLVRR
jgi:Type II CAAX prenyl endopeptidase Rce1-like